MFRKAILSFLGVGKNKKMDNYCIACKKARGKDLKDEDEKCETCSKDIKVEYLSRSENG